MGVTGEAEGRLLATDFLVIMCPRTPVTVMSGYSQQSTQLPDSDGGFRVPEFPLYTFW